MPSARASVSIVYYHSLRERAFITQHERPCFFTRPGGGRKRPWPDVGTVAKMVHKRIAPPDEMRVFLHSGKRVLGIQKSIKGMGKSGYDRWMVSVYAVATSPVAGSAGFRREGRCLWLLPGESSQISPRRS
jgi:hypothetical protein